VGVVGTPSVKGPRADLRACKTACIQDKTCRALTYTGASQSCLLHPTLFADPSGVRPDINAEKYPDYPSAAFVMTNYDDVRAVS